MGSYRCPSGGGVEGSGEVDAKRQPCSLSLLSLSPIQWSPRALFVIHAFAPPPRHTRPCLGFLLACASFFFAHLLFPRDFVDGFVSDEMEGGDMTMEEVIALLKFEH